MATQLSSQQDKAKNNLIKYGTPAAAGVACFALAYQYTPCATSCSAGAAICCGGIAALCAGIASVLSDNIGKAKDKTDAAIKVVDSNKPTTTIFPDPNPTPVPDGTTPNPDEGVSIKTPGVKTKVKLPDGRSFDLKDINNSAAMSKAGFSASEIRDIGAISKALSKKVAADLEKSATDKGDSMFGESLGTASGKSSGYSAEEIAEAKAAAAGLGSAAIKADATGLARRCGDSMCGTANDGIFIMINRQVVKQCDMSQMNCK